MVSNRRESDRVVRRLPVRFWRVGEERSVTGYTTNISTTGMFVVTHQPLPKAARIRVEILDQRCGFIVEAEVAHAHRVSLDLSALGTSGMGVRFLPIETLVRELFPERAGITVVVRRDKHRCGGQQREARDRDVEHDHALRAMGVCVDS